MTPVGYLQVKAPFDFSKDPGMAVRTSSVRTGKTEYGYGKASLITAEAVQLTVFVMKKPLPSMAPVFAHVPLRFNPLVHPSLRHSVHAFAKMEGMDRVTEVFVQVLLPSTLKDSLSLYGIQRMCQEAFPSLDRKKSQLIVWESGNSKVIPDAFSPQAISHHKRPSS